MRRFLVRRLRRLWHWVFPQRRWMWDGRHWRLTTNAEARDLDAIHEEAIKAFEGMTGKPPLWWSHNRFIKVDVSHLATKQPHEMKNREHP